MKVLQRYWPGMLSALILFVAVVIVPIWSSEDFGTCQNNGGQYPTHQATDNKAPSVGTVNTKSNWVFGSCLSGFIDQKNGGITAVATALLTLITGFLAWATILQMINGRRQIRAYVFPDSASLFDGTTVTPQNPLKAGIPGTVLIIKNSGQTPAKGVISFAKIDVIEPRHESTLISDPLKNAFSLSLGLRARFLSSVNFPAL